MASYVISDIHGELDLFEELIDKIGLTDDDTLYILGDVLDRGPYPITTLFRVMDMPNTIFIAGNHEAMALNSLRFLCNEMNEETVDALDRETLLEFLEWMENGGTTTLEEFKLITEEEKLEVVEFIENAEIMIEAEAGGKKYLLVHAGLGNYSPDKPIDDYTIDELIWERADYDTQYYDDVFVVTGHTPTQAIPENENGGYIFRKNNHIAIDCGACFIGGRLAALCLDTGEEFYSRENE